jgi:hypothetical protein
VHSGADNAGTPTEMLSFPAESDNRIHQHNFRLGIPRYPSRRSPQEPNAIYRRSCEYYFLETISVKLLYSDNLFLIDPCSVNCYTGFGRI